ncbi:hypothetical protein [Xenorhabdus mauleonii]|uniref:hypothetical protein n=1 Tax=Xenorhabdus mauleonii TaxID=351675 RepID=UPI0014747B9C|nr:hypothetical protein [Xenorhabdus mauleonii]
MRGSCLSPEASRWLFKFVLDEFVIPLPPCCILKSIEYIGYPFQEFSACYEKKCQDKLTPLSNLKKPS